MKKVQINDVKLSRKYGRRTTHAKTIYFYDNLIIFISLHKDPSTNVAVTDTADYLSAAD